MNIRIWAISLLIGTVTSILIYYSTRETIYYYQGKEVTENQWKTNSLRNERNLKDVENFKQDTTQWGGDKMYLEMEIDSINYVKEEIQNETSKYDKKYKFYFKTNIGIGVALIIITFLLINFTGLFITNISDSADKKITETKRLIVL